MSLADVRNTVMLWRRRRNQRWKVLKFLVQNENDWTSPNDLKWELPEIRDPSTVMYDMALRNPDNTPRGRGYYDRNRIYPLGYNARPILEHDRSLGYRIDPEYFARVSELV